MERLLANIYIYIYDSLFTQTELHSTLKVYSDAILGTLDNNGLMHDSYLIVRSIGFGLLLMYFVITLGTRFEGREVSPSILFKTLLELFVGFSLALFSFDIVKGIFVMGDWMAEMILEDTLAVSGALAEYTETFVNSLKYIGFLQQVLYLFKGLIPYVICIATNIIILYAIVTRVIRICVSAAVSPIAVANYFEGSRRSDAVRFLKKTLAMGLQCSVFMIITVATASMAGFMAESSVYSDALEGDSAITQSRDDMINSMKVDIKKVSSAVDAAVDKFGYKSVGDTEIQSARRMLSDPKISEVRESEEMTYKKSEDTLGVKIFKRDETGNHYEYGENGFAVVSPNYKVFSEESIRNFLDVLLGKGNYFVFILFLIVRVGLIKQSNSLCNTIVGL